MLWIAFLRAVNVGGRVVRMEHLRALFAELGLLGVRTYIQSGNVFFRTPDGEAQDRAALTARIEKHLGQALGFEVPVLLRTADEVAATLAAAPFAAAGLEPGPEIRLCVAFTSEPLPRERLPLRDPKGTWEVLDADEGAAFVVLHLENGRLGGNAGAAVERAFGVTATSRFFHTTQKILAAARK